jgi:quercetin dioxygenase-like cupin family protein
MRPYGPPTTQLPSERPVISEVMDGPDGRHFTVTFSSWQKLPQHRNASRIVITATRGSGSFSTSDGTAAALNAGDVVQVDADVPHAVAAGEDGLEITVHLIASCCGVC